MLSTDAGVSLACLALPADARLVHSRLAQRHSCKLKRSVCLPGKIQLVICFVTSTSHAVIASAMFKCSKRRGPPAQLTA